MTTNHHPSILGLDPGGLYAIFAGELGVLVIVPMSEGLAIFVELLDKPLPNVLAGHN